MTLVYGPNDGAFCRLGLGGGPTGGGVLNLSAWVDAVKASGYVGWWSGELFCRKHHQDDSFEVAAGMKALMDRLLGDRANRVIGAARLFRLSVVTVALAMAAFLLSGSVELAFAALACSGLAMANVIPLIFSAAGALGASDGGRSLSWVLSMGYAGILLGPALIGFIAEAVSLTASLSLVLIGLAVVAFFGRALQGHPAQAAKPPSTA